MNAERSELIVENRLARLNQQREQLLAEVEHRVSADAERLGPVKQDEMLADVCYHEMKRLGASGEDAERLAAWRALARRLPGLDAEGKRRELQRLVRYYGRDIVGNFDPRVYQLTSALGPAVLGFVFSPVASLRDGVRSLTQLDARITVDGELAAARRAAARGTLVVVPTHSSNMDSPVIGLALLRAGLPPVTYGAGKNLFTNPFISFFMRNLGAYRVDRRMRFALYKDVLKAYSTVLLEHGYHSLFFPGGTRCRSNMVEDNLKLGLLGTTVTAYKHHVRAGHPDKRIYIVPATINYRLVLEAETLIADYLAEVGKSRFIITDDEFSRIGRITEFFRKILVHEGSVVVRLGRPLDVFGNDVDEAGESRDRAGRVLDPAAFVRGRHGEVTDDDQRDAEYTRALGRRLVAAYPQLTVLHATHLVARALFDAIARGAGSRDVYRLLRAPQGALEVPVAVALSELRAVRERLAAHPHAGSEHPQLLTRGDAAVLDDALRGLSSYHTNPIVARHGEILMVTDLKLLYYYSNRLSHLGQGERKAVA